MKIKKAVIPAAGLGTRVLPEHPNRCPKRCSPLWTSPPSSTLWRRRSGAGIEDILIITSRGKGHGGGPLRPRPRAGSNAAGHAAKQDVYDQVVGHRQAWRTSTYLRQKETKGPGPRHSAAPRPLWADEPFAVLYGDDVIIGGEHPACRAADARPMTNTAWAWWASSRCRWRTSASTAPWRWSRWRGRSGCST